MEKRWKLKAESDSNAIIIHTAIVNSGNFPNSLFQTYKERDQNHVVNKTRIQPKTTKIRSHPCRLHFLPITKPTYLFYSKNLKNFHTNATSWQHLLALYTQWTTSNTLQSTTCIPDEQITPSGNRYSRYI